MRIDIVKGCAGICVYIDDVRVCGPKPWGGGECIASYEDLQSPEAQRVAELEQQLGETNEALAACQSEAGGLLAENERLKGVIEADDKRLSDAAISVWGEHIRGCDTPQEMAELINYLRPLAKSAELELYESFISGMKRAADIAYEAWFEGVPPAEIAKAIRAELEPVTRPEQER